MEQYTATFYTHLAAMRSSIALEEAGVQVQLAPVPRRLSSSCGTCALYEAETPMLECMDVDVEAVYRRGRDGFVLLHSNPCT